MKRGIIQGLGIIASCLIGFSATAHDAQGTSAECEAKLAASQINWVGKTLIFDTNVVINDPNALFRFPGAKIIIPGVVLDELEKHKSDPKIGRAARQFSRTIDSLREKGKINAGVTVENGTVIRTDLKDYSWLLSEYNIDPTDNDNKILSTALFYLYEAPDEDSVYLISDETNLRIKADSVGLLAKSLEYDLSKKKVETAETAIFPNYVTWTLTDSELAIFRRTGFLPKPEGLKIAPNQFVRFNIESLPEESIENFARYFYDRENPEKSGLKRLADFSHLPIQPKNIEQAMLLDVLMDPTIHLVISQSPAGTGKTFLALVAGLLQLNSGEEAYDKLMITRTLVQIGRMELGAMPGEMDKKLGHWNISVDDAFEALAKANKAQKEAEKATGPALQGAREYRTRAERRERRRLQEEAEREGKTKSFVPSKSKVHLVPFPHLRGRSITDAFLILDEAQNTSVHEIKTFLTRAGEGSKMIVLGDATQIDSPFLNDRNNGLTVTTNLVLNDEENLAGRSLAAHVVLTEGVRSLLAEYCRLLFEKL